MIAGRKMQMWCRAGGHGSNAQRELEGVRGRRLAASGHGGKVAVL